MKDLRSRYPITVAWPRSAMNLGIVNAVAIHHSVTPTLPATATEAQEIAWIDKIDVYHRSRGFGGIGYHLCAFPSGRAYYVASLRQWGANVGGQNNHLYGVCLVGTFTTVLASQQHLIGAALCVDFVDKFLKRKVALRPHRYWGGTACPGKVEGQIGSIRGLIPVPPPPAPSVQVGALIKADSTAAVYVVGSDKKIHHILNPSTFNACGFDWKAIRNASAAEKALPRGEVLGLGNIAAITKDRDAWRARAAAAENRINAAKKALG